MTIIDRCKQVARKVNTSSDWDTAFKYIDTSMSCRVLAFIKNMGRDGVRWEHRRWIETMEQGLVHYGY